MKSIKWTFHPRRMETLSSPESGRSIQDGRQVYQVYKVDDSSKKDGNLIKSIKWTVHPRRMDILLSPESGRFIQKGWKPYKVHKMEGPPYKDKNFTKPIKWMASLRRKCHFLLQNKNGWVYLKVNELMTCPQYERP